MAQKLIKKWGLFIAACLLYIAVCVFLYVIQYVIYGGTIHMPLVYVIVIPLAVLAAWLIQGGYPEKTQEDREDALLGSGIYKKEPARKRGRWHRPFKGFARKWKSEMTTGQRINFLLCTLLLTGATVFLTYALIRNPYMLMIYFYFAVLLIVGIFSLYEPAGQRRLSVLACFVFGALFAVTFLYLWIVSPMTVRDAKKALEDAGYEQVTYSKVIESDATMTLIFEDNIQYESENGIKLGCYLFGVRKDGVSMGAAVSVLDKNIVAVQPLSEGSALSFFYEFR